MKITRRPVVGGMLALGASIAACSRASSLEGEWWGQLDLGPASLRLRMVIADSEVTVFSVDQGNAELPGENVRIEGGALSFESSVTGSSYRGTLQDGRIAGEFSQLGASFPLVFGREPIPYPVPVALDGEPNPAFDGEWFGLLGVGPGALRLRLEIAGESVTLYSTDQGNAALSPDIAAIDGERVFFRIAQVDAAYLGQLADGRIAGTFTQSGGAQPLAFQRTPVETGPTLPLTQERLEALLAECGAPALAAAASGARNTLNLAAGVRSTATEAPATTGDLWHLGSITKSMTATLAARLADSGHLSWDDTLEGVLGAAVPDMRAEYRDVSLRRLCSHTAGLIRDLPLAQAAQFAMRSGDVRADRIAAARIALRADPVPLPPGQTFLYSNIGYVIAGAMLETIMDAAWEELMAEHVFAPLGMHGAGIGVPDAPDQPAGHILNPRTGAPVPVPLDVPPGDIPDYAGPAGRVYAPLEDALRYLAAHRDRDPYLSAESWDILHTPPFGGAYAMGWIVRPDGLWHNGSMGSWYAEMLFDPARGIAAAAASNLGPARGVDAAVASALAGAAEAVV